MAEHLQQALLQRIHEIDPNYVYESIEPVGGLAGMSWQGRLNVIHGLQADLAAAIYRVRGDIRPLQEVTLDFLQRATNAAYDEGVQLYDAGKLNVRLSREEAIGNYMDGIIRSKLRTFFNGLGISTEPRSAIRINNRAYDSSRPNVSYRIPDARVGNFAFDVSLEAKSSSDPQIKGFFNADFKPICVVIVRPNQLGNDSSYIIWRPEGWRIMPYKPYIPQGVGELLDHLAHMLFAAPIFKDKTGYLPRENIDTTFFSLNEGLLLIRKKLGEERYAALKALSDKMRALFEADPDDKTGDTQAGRELIHEMEDILKSAAKRAAPK